MGMLSGHGGEVTAVSWSPDGTRVASGSLDGTVRLWDARSGSCVGTLLGHGGHFRGELVAGRDASGLGFQGPYGAVVGRAERIVCGDAVGPRRVCSTR
jgi:WD40 repeat protein